MGLRVRIAWLTVLSSVLCAFTSPVVQAQYQPPSEKLLVRGTSAATWSQGTTDIIQIEGPVSIELDRAKLSAKQAVVWLTPDEKIEGQQRAEIVLLGDARVDQQEVSRTGGRLFVTGTVRGTIRITAEERASQNLGGTPLFKSAAAIRNQNNLANAPATKPVANVPATRPGAGDEPAPPLRAPPTTNASTRPAAATQPTKPIEPILFSAINTSTEQTEEGKVAVVLNGKVQLIQRRANGDVMELQAENVVLFTPLNSVKELANNSREIKRIQDAVTSAYLEGDVRITFTPGGGGMGEQRLQAKRIYYDFVTDRAVLTNAVVHTVDPQQNLPVVIRAKRIRQLSIGEYTAEKVELTTSQFALPSFSIAADRIYVRTEDTGDPRLGNRMTFDAEGALFKAFGTPLFYWPEAGGAITERGFPLRGLGIENSKRYGVGFRSKFGLFESLGKVPPEDADASVRADYFSDRGPAFGLDADYKGGYLTDPAKERWAFEGSLESYFVYDHGFDSFGRLPTRDDADTELRGHALWMHQHFFPDNWQAQVRIGYVSDATFLEEWFEREFNDREPHDLSVYLKHQEDSEAFTFLVRAQPNNLVTNADLMQEQFEVERLPEITYHRIGESLFNDQVTLFSDNRLGALRMNKTGATLREQGFSSNPDEGPGIPSLGTTGVDTHLNYRGDFRQELDYPVSLGQVRVVPYIMGRYTGYTDSPNGNNQNRLFGGTGVRAMTSFWAIDDSINSDLFDVHRMRHVITPEVNLFTAGTTVDRNEVFVYDEDVDSISDVSAAQLALHQRWQTKRGGPGKWRSVDFFTLNVSANFFSNKPDDDLRRPLGFRGRYFAGEPEASLARDSVNADFLWRLSDNTAFIGDAEYNLEQNELATGSIGIIGRRDEHLLYFLGTRYINELNSNITTLFIQYEFSPKYSIAASQSYDFGQSENVSSSLEFRRKFDNFFMTFKVHYNNRDNQSGFSFNIFPAGFGYALDSDQLESAFASQP